MNCSRSACKWRWATKKWQGRGESYLELWRCWRQRRRQRWWSPFFFFFLCVFCSVIFFLFLLSSSVSLLGATGGCGEEEQRWRFQAECGRRWFFFFPPSTPPLVFFFSVLFCFSSPSLVLLALAALMVAEWRCWMVVAEWLCSQWMAMPDGGSALSLLCVFFLFCVSSPSRFCLLLLCLFFLFLSLERWLKVELLRGDWEERWLFSSLFCLALSLSSVSQKTIPRLVSLSLLFSVLLFLFSSIRSSLPSIYKQEKKESPALSHRGAGGKRVALPLQGKVAGRLQGMVSLFFIYHVGGYVGAWAVVSFMQVGGR